MTMPVDPTDDPSLKEFWEKVDLGISPDEVVEESKLIAEAQRDVWGPCKMGVVDLHQPVRGEQFGDPIRCSKCDQELI